MLGYLWSFMIIASIIISVFTGRLSETVSAGMAGAESATSMCIGFLGVMCMWNGIIKIAQDSGLDKKISRFLQPVFRLLFSKIPVGSSEANAIIMNLSANLLGLGNAATPLGLKAMKEMKKMGRRSEMLVFTVLNTASFQLIPSTIIAMRSAAGAENPAEIILPVWCASICSVIVALLCAKIASK